jgi:hypothetical protein
MPTTNRNPPRSLQLKLRRQRPRRRLPLPRRAEPRRLRAGQRPRRLHLAGRRLRLQRAVVRLPQLVGAVKLGVVLPLVGAVKLVRVVKPAVRVASQADAILRVPGP